MELIGFVEVGLRAAVHGVPSSGEAVGREQLLAHWHCRLEDVDPNGVVTHVTGGSLNGAHRADGATGAAPAYLESGRFYNFSLRLHYTTWTFLRGHSLRVAFTNALFPMMWPSPHAMYSELLVSSEHTYVRLPLQQAQPQPPEAHAYALLAHCPVVEPEDGWYFTQRGSPQGCTVVTDGGTRW
jgi:predicted acyl esterase